MSHRYTLFGNPVEHSLSPKIHQLFGEQTHRPLSYTTTLASAADFESRVRAFFADGGAGCNVTVPFKESAAALCDALSPAAELAGAANTLMISDGDKIHGHNTDGSGLIVDLTQNLGLSLQGAHILIAGAGGASRGILGPLLHESPARVVIVNRDADKAANLAGHFTELGNVSGSGYEQAAAQQTFDLVINATSLGLSDDRPPLPDTVVGADTVAYDLMYGKDTAFLVWAGEHGATTHDGLGMLLEQAADAFELWEGVRPKSRLMRSRL